MFIKSYDKDDHSRPGSVTALSSLSSESSHSFLSPLFSHLILWFINYYNLYSFIHINNKLFLFLNDQFFHYLIKQALLYTQIISNKCSHHIYFSF